MSFRVSTGKDGAKEYVKVSEMTYARDLTKVLKSSTMTIEISYPEKMEVTGKLEEVMRELVLLQLLYGQVKYKIKAIR